MMKWLIASDIHGSSAWCDRLMRAWDTEKADRLLLLGDILYHGPRNDLPAAYAPKLVIDMLSERKSQIVSIRGNCDTEVDQMVLPFPIMAEYAYLMAGSRLVFATHGHIFNEENLPPIHAGDILLYGHTHVPRCEESQGILYMNPGSVSIPKEGSPHSYMTLEDGLFQWKDLLGDTYMRYQMEE